MGNWGVFDWMTYGALTIGALILAAETGLSQSPSLMRMLPSFFRHPLWGVAPLCFVLIATGMFGARAAGLIGEDKPSSAAIVDTPVPDRSKVFLQLWGVLKPFTYQVTIDASQLGQFKDKYRLILVVRSSFSDVDRMTDEYLETSDLYTIEDSLMTLAHPSSNKLRFLVEGPNVVEYNVAILPDHVSEKEVTTLNSIEHLGGKIIASASQIIIHQTTVKRSPFCSVINC
jgi:hypothetical protein